MARKSALDKAEIGQEAITLALSNMSQGQIATTLNAKHGLSLDRYAVGHYLRRNSAQIVPLEEISAQAKSDNLTFTFESVRKLLGDIYSEVQSKIDSFEGRPRDFAAFLRVKLDLLDKMAKLTGAYVQPDSLIAVQVNTEGPGTGRRCQNCPHKDRFTQEELKRLLTEGDPLAFSKRKPSTSDEATTS